MLGAQPNAARSSRSGELLQAITSQDVRAALSTHSIAVIRRELL